MLSERAALVIRRQILRPGEATPWHRDPCERFSVVVRGDRLRIEYRDGELEEFSVAPGEAGWNCLRGWMGVGGLLAGPSSYPSSMSPGGSTA